jgi:hypothetical protein
MLKCYIKIVEITYHISWNLKQIQIHAYWILFCSINSKR